MSRLGSIGGRLYRGEQADPGLLAATLQERDVAWSVVQLVVVGPPAVGDG